jgi:hypothetical protein
MGWSSPPSTPTDAGYRPYEGDLRGGSARGAATAAVVAIAGIALGADPLRLAGAALLGGILLGAVHASTELRRLRKGLAAAGTGPLPLLETPREDGTRPDGRSLGSMILVVLVLFALVAHFVFSFDEAVRIVLGGMAGHAAGEALVLGWFCRRRRRDRIQVYVRDVEGDDEAADPPRFHLVPRGS